MSHRSRARRALTPLALACVISVLAGCGLSGTPSGSSSPSSGGDSAAGSVAVNNATHPATSTLCGSKPIKIVFQMDFDTTWGAISYAELQKEAKSCPNVTTEYVNSSGDQQKAITNLQSAVAKGVDGIVLYPGFGQSELPAIAAAYKAGIPIVPFNAVVGGEPGEDFTAFVTQDQVQIGRDQAEWIGKQLGGKGDIAFLGGPDGNSSTAAIFSGFTEVLSKEYPAINVLTGNPVATDWTASGTQQAMAGLLARFSTIDGIVADYGAPFPGAIRAYQAAGKPLPIVATDGGSNELACSWLGYAQSGQKFLSLDGSTLIIQVAFRKVLSAISGVSDNEADTLTLYPFIDTAAGKQPQCFPDLPPGADLSGDLSPSDLKDLIG